MVIQRLCDTCNTVKNVCLKKSNKTKNNLTKEEAAEIGSQMIWELFGSTVLRVTGPMTP